MTWTTETNACLRKKAYSKRQALAVVKRMRQQDDVEDKLRLTIYPCRFCKKYHVTSHSEKLKPLAADPRNTVQPVNKAVPYNKAGN